MWAQKASAILDKQPSGHQAEPQHWGKAWGEGVDTGMEVPLSDKDGAGNEIKRPKPV